MEHRCSQIKRITAINLQRTILCRSSLCLVINGDVFWHIDRNIVSMIPGQCDIRCFLHISITDCFYGCFRKGNLPFRRFFHSKQMVNIGNHPCFYQILILASRKSCLTCVSIAGCDMRIYILLFFCLTRQITSGNIPRTAIAIIQHFLQVFIAVQYLCHIISTWR